MRTAEITTYQIISGRTNLFTLHPAAPMKTASRVFAAEAAKANGK
jgi:hypothetical protein